MLAPAGGWPQLHAAVENGADAIYLGLSSFNARARAENFTQRELKDACDYCHARGVRVFVTLNVLVFEEELADVEALVRGVAEGGADAIIVQDVGVAEVARRVAPNLRIHGSTQMSVTSGAAPSATTQLAGGAHLWRICAQRSKHCKPMRAATNDSARALRNLIKRMRYRHRLSTELT